MDLAAEVETLAKFSSNKLVSLSKKVNLKKVSLNRNLSKAQNEPNRAPQPGVSEQQVRDFYTSTNWGG